MRQTVSQPQSDTEAGADGHGSTPTRTLTDECGQSWIPDRSRTHAETHGRDESNPCLSVTSKSWTVPHLHGDHAGDSVLEVGATIRRDRGDDVADPAEQAARANPEARRHDQPEQTAKEVAVVELADARDDQAQHRRGARALRRHDDLFHTTAYGRMFGGVSDCEGCPGYPVAPVTQVARVAQVARVDLVDPVDRVAVGGRACRGWW